MTNTHDIFNGYIYHGFGRNSLKQHQLRRFTRNLGDLGSRNTKVNGKTGILPGFVWGANGGLANQ